jgi:hypothetical protein
MFMFTVSEPPNAEKWVDQPVESLIIMLWFLVATI